MSALATLPPPSETLGSIEPVSRGRQWCASGRGIRLLRLDIAVFLSPSKKYLKVVVRYNLSTAAAFAVENDASRDFFDIRKLLRIEEFAA